MSKIARQSKDYRIKNMPFCTLYHKLISKRPNQSELWETNRIIAQITNLVFNLVCPGKSRLEYCLDNALRSPSPLPLPPWAGSKVGRAAVVIFLQFHALFTSATPPRYSNMASLYSQTPIVRLCASCQIVFSTQQCLMWSHIILHVLIITDRCHA